jgi:hypothetical protein
MPNEPISNWIHNQETLVLQAKDIKVADEGTSAGKRKRESKTTAPKKAAAKRSGSFLKLNELFKVGFNHVI